MAIANSQFQKESFGSVSPDDNNSSSEKQSHQGEKPEEIYEEAGIVEQWAHELKDLPVETVKKAWFTMSHIMVDPGAHVIDMGCSDGAMAYAMAVLNPNIKFTAVDMDGEAIKYARKKYQRSNLCFEKGDISRPLFEDNSVDAIINSFILHEIYSGHNYNENVISRVMESQYRQLKDNGMIFIRDYAINGPEEMVLLEMPDIHTGSDDPETMSDPELLEYYADRARASAGDKCCGFPLEELPQRYPGTRLFRLPHKWAYEFIVRNNERGQWLDEIGKEYTFYTQKDFTRNLSALGTRVLYTAPHWNDSFVNNHYLKHFRMYDDDGKPMGAPPTSYIALAKKLPERKSLALEERRTAKNTSGMLQIHAMRNEMDGKNIDIATRDMHTVDIIPYRIGTNNRLKVFLHDGAPRPIMNTIPRNGKVLDGKRWSGHMIEAICVDVEEYEKFNFEEFKDNVKFLRDYIGIKPVMNAKMEDGPNFFPAPDFLDDRIETKFVNIQDDIKAIEPKYLTPDKQGFSDVGEYREFDAQDILDAIAVGLIPLGRLEMQIMALYKKLGLQSTTWAECPLVLKEPPGDAYDNLKSSTQILQLIDMVDERFKDIKGTVGDLRIVPSVFVDEGKEAGGIAGLASREMDFVISDDKTVNMAVVLPLSRDHSGEVLACMQQEYLPVPQRYKGSSSVVKAPSVELPKEVTSIEDAKRFIADKFGTGIENVAQMGEPYFSHIGMTPQRIFPFAITGAAEGGHVQGGTFYAPISKIADILYWGCDFVLWETCKTMLRFSCTDSELAPARRFQDCLSEAKYKSVSNLSYGDSTSLDRSSSSSSSVKYDQSQKVEMDMPRPTEDTATYDDWGDPELRHS